MVKNGAKKKADVSSINIEQRHSLGEHIMPLLTPANVVAVLFIVAVLVGSFLICFQSFFLHVDSSNNVARVHSGDGEVYDLSLDVDTELYIQTEYGTNIVAVKDGEVFMLSADCDGQDCMHQGSISSLGKQIICLPHKLWIEVVSIEDSLDDLEEEFDLISR